MAEPFIGEMRIFGCNYAPRGWAMCNGQLMAISQNTALFSLLGTQFGGDGRTTFALPNLQGNVPICQGQGPGLSEYVMGEIGGAGSVTLLSSEMPMHNHTANCSTNNATTESPANGIWATTGTRGASINAYLATAGMDMNMNLTASGLAGSGQPHDNMPPYLTLNFCIALQGLFPSRQ